MNREGFRTHTLFVVLVTISLLICSIPRSAAVELGVSPTASESEYQGVGPSIDTLTFNVIPGIEQKIEALVNDEIDIIGSEVYPAYLPTLEAAENVEVEKSPRNGCGQMIINCAKYPLNITAFRRALAFAVDKHRISEDVWDGLAQPQDSCVPSGNPWSSEGKLGYDYYQANALRGNQILDAAGFVDLDSDGIREAPNGSEFSVVIECASSSDVAIETGAIVAEALQALHIDATSMAVDFYDYLDRLYIHGDFDMCFIGKSFNDFDVDWLAYEYWSEYADEPYYNFPMFKNASYDSWRDQLLHSTDYDEVYEAAIEMQKIWVYQVPSLICYENQVLYAYRTDKYAGHVNDALYGTPNFWTNYRVHLKQSEGGPTGGDFRYGMDWCPDLNFMRSPVTIADRMLDNLYDSLLRRGPDGKDLPWLATSYTAQTHAQNSSIPSGHTRFVFQVVRNATWSNGWPLTADDIAFSLNFYKNGFGIWLGVDLVDMVSATAPTPYELVVEFSTESYWHLHTIAYKYVISELAFASITPSNWSSWNPDPETMVTSGPFLFSDRAIDEFCRLAKNPRYFLRPNEPPTVSSPPDMTYVVNTTGHSITWNATDTDPLLWMVFKNDTLYAMNIFWDGGPITIKIDNLTLGCYNFTLYVADASMNIVTDSVFVYVVEADYLLPVLVTAGVASAVVVVAVVVLGARRRTPLG